MANECDAVGVSVEPYRQININSRWSPMMFHRLATLDVLAALERDCQSLAAYRLVKTLVEYRREKIGRDWRKETTDFVASPHIPENKIVPDAGFVLENEESGKRALFLIEVDCGTERLTTSRPDAIKQTFSYKLAQYDRYLASRNVEARYAAHGGFKGFRLLVVTTSAERVNNMRNAAASLSHDYDQFYRFSTLDDVRQKFLHDGWLSRDNADHQTYQLIKGN